MSECNKPHTNTSNATNFVSLVQPPLGENEIAQIALRLYELRDGKSYYEECVRMVKEAHGIGKDKEPSHADALEEATKVGYENGWAAAKEVLADENKELTNQLLCVSKENIRLRQKVSSLERAEFKEFLESINQPENK